MHLPLHTTLLPILLPLLPYAHPFTARQLTCNTTPSPHLQYADCLRALTDILDLQLRIGNHPADLSALTLLTATGPTGASNRLPRSFVAGTCRVNVQLANGVGAVRILWTEVMARALNCVHLCVEADVPKGGSSTFGALKVVVEEVVPRVRLGCRLCGDGEWIEGRTGMRGLRWDWGTLL